MPAKMAFVKWKVEYKITMFFLPNRALPPSLPPFLRIKVEKTLWTFDVTPNLYIFLNIVKIVISI